MEFDIERMKNEKVVPVKCYSYYISENVSIFHTETRFAGQNY